MHREPLYWLRQLRYEGSRDPIVPRRLVVRHGLLHGIPESWHEAIIWLMPKGTAGGKFGRVQAYSVGAARHADANDPPHEEVHGSPST